MNISTTIEQSKKLLSLGLKPETADMYYKYVLPKSDKIYHVPEIGNPIESLEWYNEGYTFRGKEPIKLNEFCVPAWSLSALLELMPDGIQTYKTYNYIRIDITFVRNGIVTGSHRVENKTYIDAAVEMIEWLITNKYIQV